MGRAAGFTGASAMNYKEDRQGTIGALTYSVQGNILTSRAVIDQAETAFRNTGCDLADKLMLALEAGAMNGEGDSRCTPRGVPSDAASIEVDLTGATAGSYLKLAVAGTGNTSAVVQLRAMFNTWRTTHACGGGAGGAGGAGGGGAARGGRGGAGGAAALAAGRRGGAAAAARAGSGGAGGAGGAAAARWRRRRRRRRRRHDRHRRQPARLAATGRAARAARRRAGTGGGGPTPAARAPTARRRCRRRPARSERRIAAVRRRLA